MKRILLVIVLMVISSTAYADALQETYKRWACNNTCTVPYTETETNFLGNRVTYKCIACKYQFCMLPGGETIKWEYNYYKKMTPGAEYPFIYRWAQY